MLTGMRAMDMQGRITYVNAAFCQMTGWTEAELVGRTPPFPYWPKSDRDALSAKLEDQLKGRDASQGGSQVRVKRKDSTHFDARLYMSPLIDAVGKQTGWVTSMTDITEPNRIREQLSASYERFTTVLEALDAAVSVAPLGSEELLFANKLYRLWFGTQTSGHLQMVAQAGMPQQTPSDESLDEVDSFVGLPTGALTTAQSGNAEIFVTELGKWIEVRSRYLNWVDGRLAQMVIATDITPRRVAEEQSAAQAERAQSASRLITMGEMASSVAHELNQPLTAINNYCNGMVSRIKSKQITDDDLLMALEKTAHQAQRAGQIIQRIRSFVKRSEPNRAPADVSSIVAEALELAEIELRRRNFIQPSQMPYGNPMAQVYDSGKFEQVMNQGLLLADWAGFDAREAASKQRGKLRGLGIATFLEWTGGNALEENVRVDVTADGFIELTSATMGMGQGIATSYVQLAHDVFGVPLDRIRVLQGDTDRANGFGSAGSRSLFTGGAAVRVASEKAVDEGKKLAGDALEAPAADIEYTAGRFTVAGTDLSIGLFELAQRQGSGRLTVSASATAAAPSWPNGCHVAEVEIDPATGDVQVVAYASVNDIGRVVSPTIVQGQVEGGAVQGIGQALCEQVVYDAESAQLLSASFMDYALPRVDGFRAFKTAFDQSVPCLTNTLGAKGVGELGTIGATPAVVNAVVDALAHTGLGRRAEAVQMPLTSEVVWRALRGQFPLPLNLPA